MILVLNKYCIPDVTTLENAANDTIQNFTKTFYEKFNVDKLSDYIMDLIKVYPVMLISIGVAFVTGIIYMIFLRCFAGLIIWFSILGVAGILGGGGYWAYATRNNYQESDNNYKYL